MTEQSSALRTLEQVFDTAITEGDASQKAGIVLAKILGKPDRPESLVIIFGLLNKAVNEAQALSNKSFVNGQRITRNLKQLQLLNSFLITNSLWGMAWRDCKAHIEQRNYVVVLHSLADEYFKQFPFIQVPQDTLNGLAQELSGVLEKVIDSNLAPSLKQYLVDALDEIISTIRNYQVGGTESLYKVSRVLSYGLLEINDKTSAEEKKKPAYTAAAAWILSLTTFFTPQTIYDVAGLPAAMRDFYLPTFEQLLDREQQIESSIEQKIDLYDVLKSLNNEEKPIETQAILEPQISPKQPRLESAKLEEE